MNPSHILIVDDSTEMLQHVATALQAVGVACTSRRDAESACDVLASDGRIELAIVRLQSEQIDGLAMCSRLRSQPSTRYLPILMLIEFDDLARIGDVLDAGATDVLLVPFEPRELRFKVGVAMHAQQRRVDPPDGDNASEVLPPSHLVSNEAATVAVSREAAGPRPATSEAAEDGIDFIAPQFDPDSCQYRLPVDVEVQRRWSAHPAVRQVELDTVLVCPHCNGLPSVRLGCHCCGSALRQPERLIHHYACAHVGPEASYRRGHELTCPKCLQRELVAGSDFELVDGADVCAECQTVIYAPTLVCQCLRCQHRFPSEEAVSQTLVGYEVPRRLRQHAPPQPPARTANHFHAAHAHQPRQQKRPHGRPRQQRAMSRLQRRKQAHARMQNRCGPEQT